MSSTSHFPEVRGNPCSSPPLFEAKLCMQNEFITWGSTSLREKGTRSYSWRGWTFFHPLKGISKPKRQVLTLQRAVSIAGGDLRMSITQHISGSSWRFQEQHWTPAMMAGVPVPALWLLTSRDYTIRIRDLNNSFELLSFWVPVSPIISMEIKPACSQRRKFRTPLGYTQHFPHFPFTRMWIKGGKGTGKEFA